MLETFRPKYFSQRTLTPKTPLDAIMQNEVFSILRYQHTESLFEEELFPANIPIEQRAQHWIAIFSMLDDTEKKGLTFLLTIKER